MKNLLLTIATTFVMTAITMAQNVPYYVPTNGLVGWWPFNGNADDESGNGNNGVVNGPVLTTDRFGINNSAYEFNSNIIDVGNNNSLNINISGITISAWIIDNSGGNEWHVLGIRNQCGDFQYQLSSNNLPFGLAWGGITPGENSFINSGLLATPSQWNNLIGTFDGGKWRLYLNAVNIDSLVAPITDIVNTNLIFGNAGNCQFFQGKIDDMGIWNRALTQQEITALYNATNCANNTAITPQINSLITGSTALFNATTSDPNPNYVWQSNFGQGFQTLNDFGNYSGTNSGTLSIANVQLPNHTQPIRVITTSANCIDTSNVAIISITDTCINTITDTTLITVTDTLLINTTITGLNPPNNANTIKVFPNPTNDHITIDYGNFSVMNGYQLKIENSIGQQVFQTNISQQSDYLNLTTWGGNGLYFVHIIDPQGNTIDIRKIVLQ